MSATSAGWRFEYEGLGSLPPLAWIARIRDGVVRVQCGRSVRCEGAGFFEGTWAGPGDLACAASATTVFGSGIVLDGSDLVVVPPAHTLDPIYHATEPDATLVVANTFVGLLAATGRELDEVTPYPLLFGSINRGITHGKFDIPTTDAPVTVNFYENLRVAGDGKTTIRPKPREKPFTSFADYRDRLIERSRSCFANAVGYEPAVALSSGYDSTAAAAVVARAGCRRAFTFRTGWAWAGYSGDTDSGERAAAALGLSVQFFDRHAYMELDDTPDAEFLASGMTGEDVIYRSMESALPRSVLVSGFWGGAAWRGKDRANISRADLSGASMGEFRLRVDMIHLPLPYIGGIQQPSMTALRDLPDTLAYSVGGVYDEPIARRLAEEAGVPRQDFGIQKRATSQRISKYGLDALSPSARASFEEFAGDAALSSLPRKAEIKRRHRIAIKLANALHVPRLVDGLVERRWRVVHLEPTLGSLLLRWAVARLRPRYAAAAKSDGVSD